jgi:hypothetical protein
VGLVRDDDDDDDDHDDDDDGDDDDNDNDYDNEGWIWIMRQMLMPSSHSRPSRPCRPLYLLLRSEATTARYAGSTTMSSRNSTARDAINLWPKLQRKVLLTLVVVDFFSLLALAYTALTGIVDLGAPRAQRLGRHTDPNSYSPKLSYVQCIVGVRTDI